MAEFVDLKAMHAAIPGDVLEPCRALRRAGFEAWLVGGAVRDLCRGKPAKDFDIATSAHPHEVTRVFGRRRTIPTGAKHGTVTVLLEDPHQPHPAEPEPPHHPRVRQVEVTTFRGDGAYSDGRRPDSVQFVSDLVEDLRRRDFTMNAMAYDPLGPRGADGGDEVGVLADPFGGHRDLAAGLIRAVGDPLERFREDGLRVMRAARFAAQLEFRLDPATEAAIPPTIDVFRKVSQERVRDELLKILGSRRPSIGLHLMQRTGLLEAVLPELVPSVGHPQNRFHAHDVWEHTVVTVDETPGDRSPAHAVVRLASLLHDVAKPATAAPREGAPGEYSFFNHEIVGAEMAEAIARRLRLSTREREKVVALVRHHMFWYSPDWTDATVRRFINRIGLEDLYDLYALRVGDVLGRGRGEDPAVELAELQRRVEAEIAAQRALKITDLAIGGEAVMRLLDVRPGRIVGDVLKRLLERVIEEPALNTVEALSALVPETAREVASGKAPPVVEDSVPRRCDC